MIVVSVCLPSDALPQRLLSYLGFSYLGLGVSLHGCSSKAQPLLLILGHGVAPVSCCPNFGCGVAPLSRSCIVSATALLHMVTAAMKLKDTYSLEGKL